MKKIFFVLLIVCNLFVINLINAQTILYSADARKMIPGAEMLVINKGNMLPSYFKFSKGEEISISKLDYLLYSILKIDNAFDKALINSTKDELGEVHYRYQLTYNNFPLQDAIFIVHTKNDKIFSVNGNLYKNIQISNSITLTESAALQQLLGKINAKKYKWQVPEEEKLLQQECNNPSATYYPKAEIVLVKDNASQQYVYTYSFNVYAVNPLKRAIYYVNTSNGDVVFENNLIHEANANGTAITKFSGTQSIITDSTAINSFRLRETVRGLGIETYNMQKTTNYATAVDFLDSNNYWNNVNTTKDEVATDAHWGAEKTWDFYYYKFNRNSVDNLGFKIKSYVHYDVNYANAFWDGQRMTYGDGNTTWLPLVALDICGHEITHGVDTYTANLNYSNESGAMNEAFSDIFGTAIEFYAKPSTANWLIGSEIGTPIRSMSNPNLYTQPDTYGGTNWYTGTADNGGVHTNSGVLNFWFYLLSVGGSGTNDNSQLYNVTGISIDTAERIAYRMLTVYLTPTSQYADARFYGIVSATDLYGPCSQPVQSTTNAFYAVGIGSVYVPGVHSNFVATNVSYCETPANVNFVNQSNNASTYLWDFGDGSTSTAFNPTHTYNNYGTYNVKLVANGGNCGIDSITKLNYISVSTSNPCIVIMPLTGGLTVNSCTGVLYDNGADSNYKDNSDVTTTISPAGAASIAITFTTFGFENNYDYLYIYDGTSTSSTLIGQYTGTSFPNGGTVTSTTGSITVRLTSDGAVNDIGFIAHWQCIYPTIPPICNFKVSDTLSCTGIINFTDISTNGPNNWLWRFGDGTTSTLQNPSHTYTSNGYYSVKLFASNNFGADSIIKTNIIHINKPVDPIIPNDTSNCGATSFLFTVSGNGNIKWFDTPIATTPIDTGLVHQTPVLTASTTYYIESQVDAPSIYGGKYDTVGTGAYYTQTTKHYLVFDCFAQSRIKSVKVSASAAGTKIIQLQNSAGTVLLTKTVTVPKGTSRVTLDFDVPAGTDYRLVGPATPNLWRNSANTNYPYLIGNLITIKYSSATTNPTGSYYYFYDWEVRGEACKSNRLPLNVFINTGNPVSSFTNANNALSVAFTNTSTQANTYLWKFGDGATSVIANPTHNYTSAGTYNVKLIVSNACGSDSVTNTITVNVGVNENNLINNISIYPNPTNTTLFISIPVVTSENVKLQLLNITGQMEWSNSLNSAGNSALNTSIDMSALAKGVYFLHVQQQDKLIVRKIIKM
ncbi:MAG: M4 family metallopeptidase [Bacteroidetes bacterium]|nr:M4 family metallopeptidase [Bacteroidota bacterium]